MEKQLADILSSFEGKSSELIPVLQRIQDYLGYLPEEAMLYAAKFLNVPESKVFGVASFYLQFRLSPVGKYIIKVCHGTACHVLNATELSEQLENNLKIKDGETTKDGMFTLESVACLGCCSLAPVIMIKDEVYGKLDGKKAVEVVNEFKKNNI